MKLLLVIFTLTVCLVSFTLAGVSPLKPEIDEQALALWTKYCSSPSPHPAEGYPDNGRTIYCKISEEPVKRQYKTSVDANGTDQVVFIQPPTYHLIHNVTVTQKKSNVNIFVKPPPINNTYITYVEQQKNKPIVYFLNKSHEDAREGTTPATRGPIRQLPSPTPGGWDSQSETYSQPNPPVQMQNRVQNYDPTHVVPTIPNGGFGMGHVSNDKDRAALPDPCCEYPQIPGSFIGYYLPVEGESKKSIVAVPTPPSAVGGKLKLMRSGSNNSGRFFVWGM